MSSKFSRGTKVQKPPAVCKKPPPALDVPWPHPNQRRPSLHFAFDDYVYSDRVHFADNLEFQAYSPPMTWAVWVEGDLVNWYITLDVPTAVPLNRYFCHVYKGYVYEFTRSAGWALNRSTIPFDSGLRFATDAVDPFTIRFRAMA